MHKRKTFELIAFILLSLIGYIWVGYYTVRTDFTQLVLIFGFLFALYILALYRKIFDLGFPVILGSAMLLRACLILMTPNLTDDYFRFIWDGLLFTHGLNPYLFIPSQFIQSSHNISGITTSLYTALNSPNYYTVYPPVCEFIFGFNSRIAGVSILGNLIVTRLIIIMAEFGTIVFLKRLCSKFAFSLNKVAIYAFNPLVVLELTGNLHLEAVMLLFLILAIYLLVLDKQIWSALSFGLAVGTKLVPLIFLPLLIKRLGLAKSAAYFTIVGATVLALFLPFYNASLFPDFFSSLRLYFQTFEFNASIYYVLRWLGYLFTGYNIIAILGIVLSIITFLIVVAIAAAEKKVTWLSMFNSMLICLTAYLLLSTTVHPWYITTLVLISLFTSYRYPILWSLLIILSYAAYRSLPYTENLWLVAAEYMVLLSYMGYELFRNFRNKSASQAI
jgi:alpha-1,6-mannosyltransferase